MSSECETVGSFHRMIYDGELKRQLKTRDRFIFYHSYECLKLKESEPLFKLIFLSRIKLWIELYEVLPELEVPSITIHFLFFFFPHNILERNHIFLLKFYAERSFKPLSITLSVIKIFLHSKLLYTYNCYNIDSAAHRRIFYIKIKTWTIKQSDTNFKSISRIIIRY